MGSILAIDYGTKRIGLAVSDPSRIFAFPLGVIENKNMELVLSDLRNITSERDIDLILIGMPFNMDKTKSEMTIKVEKFVKKITEELNLKVEIIDERLSSFAAEENLKESKLSSEKIKKYVDSEAARLILEEYLRIEK